MFGGSFYKAISFYLTDEREEGGEEKKYILYFFFFLSCGSEEATLLHFLRSLSFHFSLSYVFLFALREQRGTEQIFSLKISAEKDGNISVI